MTRKSLIAATLMVLFTAALATTTFGFSGQRNTLKFSSAVALPGTLLPAGEYQFLVVPGNPDIVRVTGAPNNKAYYAGFTRTVSRPRSLGRDRAIILGESPEGTPRPIAVWFPTDGGNGHEFVY